MWTRPVVLMIMIGKDVEKSEPLAVLGRRSEKTGGEDACKKKVLECFNEMGGYKEKLL